LSQAHLFLDGAPLDACDGFLGPAALEGTLTIESGIFNIPCKCFVASTVQNISLLAQHTNNETINLPILQETGNKATEYWMDRPSEVPGEGKFPGVHAMNDNAKNRSISSSQFEKIYPLQCSFQISQKSAVLKLLIHSKSKISLE
jgi:hypothetical protein